jgi:hypothetical protein
VIQILIGLLNIIGGVVLITKRFLPLLYDKIKHPAKPVVVTPIVIKLLITQTLANIIAIIFGITILVPGIGSGLIISTILVVNGLLILALAYFLRKIH